MDQEASLVEDRIEDPSPIELHGHRFVTGTLAGTSIVNAVTGYGKVGAAATTASVIHEFDVSAVVFGGVAGGIRPDIGIGDVVVADRLIQHDYDVSPLFQRYVIPSLGLSEIPTDSTMTAQLQSATDRYLQHRAHTEIAAIPANLFEVASMKRHTGLIASGDRFISSLAEAATLQGELPEVLAVEMEGAAVAQVCAEREIPFGVFRLISDRSDHDAEYDFIAFVSSVAAPITAGIVEEFLAELS